MKASPTWGDVWSADNKMMSSSISNLSDVTSLNSSHQHLYDAAVVVEGLAIRGTFMAVKKGFKEHGPHVITVLHSLFKTATQTIICST